MGCEEKKSNTNLLNLILHKKSKGNLFTEKPIFCNNGNSLVVSCGSSLCMYSTSTGNFLRELFQSSDKIISCQLHPLKDTLLIAITENGELIVYNLETSDIEYSLRLVLNQKFLNKQYAPKFDSEQEYGSEFDWEKQALESVSDRKFLYAEVKGFHNNPSEMFVWTTWSLNDELQCHLSAFTLKNGKHIKLIQAQNSGFRKCYLNFVISTVEGFEVFVGMSDYFVHIIRYDIQKHPYSSKHYIGFDKTLSCLAFHPTECCFATGDSRGKITIWRNIFEKYPLKDIFHWHTLPVRDIFFSKFGNYMFSGGDENVLVKWSLTSHTRDYLPRLSSAIHRIFGHCESSLLSISTADNKILIVDFNCQNVSTIQHFSKWTTFKAGGQQKIFTIDPRSNSIVLNGRTGHIQFLSLNEDGKFIYTFDVTNRNFITSDADHVIENTEVTHARFNKNGKWLVTVESRWDESCKESRLKVWLYCDKQNSFSLNTNVEFPHENCAVLALELSSDDMAVTTGGDGKFRLWTVFEHAEKQFWAMHAVGKYHNFPCNDADFSVDASLVAVTFGPVLTVWETDTCDLKCTLSVPYRKDELKFCKFGNFEFSHLLVTCTDFIITAWNVITLSVIWTVPLKVNLLISDSFSLYMVAFSADNTLIVFSPSSPAPEFLLKKVSDSPVVAAHCTSDRAGKLCLYFLNADQELFCVEDGEKAFVNHSFSLSQSTRTPFAAQQAQIQNRSEPENTTVFPDGTNHSVSSLMDAPAHTLPNPSVICTGILKSLLLFASNVSSGGQSYSSAFSSSSKSASNSLESRVKKISREKVHADFLEAEDKLLDIVKTIFV